MADPLQSMAQALHDSETAPAPVAVPALPDSPRRVYSPEAMVQLIIDHPNWSHAELASYFGRLPSWTSAVLASDAFQRALDGRRHEVADPSLSATMEERFRALAIQSTAVLQKKLESTAVNDLVVLKAVELGVKALGLGQKQPEAPALPAPQNSSQSVAEKLLEAMDKRDQERDRLRTVDVETVEVRDGQSATD